MKREKTKMTQKQNTLTKTGIVALLACICCILWGSAIPVIKTGYRLMQVDSADTASQIVFAGVRFTLAGILVLIFASIREKKVMIPDKEILKYAVPVCLAQTVGQYFFFYIGVAHTSGVKGGIITGLGNFIAILMSCLIFRNERMTGRKILFVATKKQAKDVVAEKAASINRAEVYEMSVTTKSIAANDWL